MVMTVMGTMVVTVMMVVTAVTVVVMVMMMTVGIGTKLLLPECFVYSV